VFRVPTMTMAAISEETNKVAVGLDAMLQEWLSGYLKRTKTDQVAVSAQHVRDEDMDNTPLPSDEDNYAPITEDDIPFAWMMPLVLPALGLLVGAMVV
jgi:hypothetical protein